MAEHDVEPMSLDELAAEGDAMEESGEGPFEEVAALQAERDEFRDKFMRALADSENMRKRSERDRREAENYGGSKLARDLLPVYDNLRRALQAADDSEKEVSAPLP